MCVVSEKAATPAGGGNHIRRSDFNHNETIIILQLAYTASWTLMQALGTKRTVICALLLLFGIVRVAEGENVQGASMSLVLDSVRVCRRCRTDSKSRRSGILYQALLVRSQEPGNGSHRHSQHYR